MIRHLLIVLLMATGIAVAENSPQASPAAGDADVQAATDSASMETEVAMQDAPIEVEASAVAQTDKKPVEKSGDSAKVKTGDAAKADETAKAESSEEAKPKEEEAKLTSVRGSNALGMSILGNQDAPKSLVIVPWKSSGLGGVPAVSPMLDDSRQPVDKDVFMRALSYYEIRSESKD